jgi:hypothetical protein
MPPVPASFAGQGRVCRVAAVGEFLTLVPFTLPYLLSSWVDAEQVMSKK